MKKMDLALITETKKTVTVCEHLDENNVKVYLTEKLSDVLICELFPSNTSIKVETAIFPLNQLEVKGTLIPSINIDKNISLEERVLSRNRHYGLKEGDNISICSWGSDTERKGIVISTKFIDNNACAILDLERNMIFKDTCEGHYVLLTDEEQALELLLYKEVVYRSRNSSNKVNISEIEPSIRDFLATKSNWENLRIQDAYHGYQVFIGREPF